MVYEDKGRLNIRKSDLDLEINSIGNELILLNEYEKQKSDINFRVM